jgi:4-hydroxybenzoate polyprenyltransferase
MSAAPLHERLWTYQSERFPVIRNGLVLLAYGAAMAFASAHLGGRGVPPAAAVASAFIVTFLVFFQLRACDEVKDLEHDARYQPERAIPRGLVSLREVVGAGIATAPVALAAAVLVDARLLWALAAVWVWMGLMTVEFFVPAWLRARPVAYMVSHMVIVPLITLYATACEWLPAGQGPPPGLAALLALSYANGCVNEIGRKIRAPGSERPGVETYTALWGMRTACLAWLGCVLAALAAMMVVGWIAGAGRAVAAAGIAGALGVAGLAAAFLARPTPALGKACDLASGLWVLVCYLAVGFLPVLLR